MQLIKIHTYKINKVQLTAREKLALKLSFKNLNSFVLTLGIIKRHLLEDLRTRESS